MSKKRILIIAVVILCVCLGFIGWFFIGHGGAYTQADGSYATITASHSVKYVQEHPAFDGCGQFINPWRDPVNQILTPFESWRGLCAVNPYPVDMVLGGLNFMIEQQQAQGTIFYPYYSEDECAEDPTKTDTGLFFIKAEQPNAPFALVVPGGGLTSVCTIAEGFPIAQELNEKGYNVFILQYRVSPDTENNLSEHMDNQEKISMQDFGAALQYIFDNAQTFEVSTDNYSIWGFSAGGRLCHLWGMNNSTGYDAYSLPKPALSVLAYSGWYEEWMNDFYSTQPPTFLSYTEGDQIIGSQLVEDIHTYAQKLQEADIPVWENVYQEAPHGFGTGLDTDAEGWMEDAISVWQQFLAM